jgi:hypothetical protein
MSAVFCRRCQCWREGFIKSKSELQFSLTLNSNVEGICHSDIILFRWKTLLSLACQEDKLFNKTDSPEKVSETI